jgi:hypothetical protein
LLFWRRLQSHKPRVFYNSSNWFRQNLKIQEDKIMVSSKIKRVAAAKQPNAEKTNAMVFLGDDVYKVSDLPDDIKTLDTIVSPYPTQTARSRNWTQKGNRC